MIKLLLISLLSLSAYAELLVITHKDGPFVPKSTLEDVYLGENSALEPSDQSKLSKDFYEKLLGLSMSKVNKIWGVLVFTGRSDRPIRFSSDEDVIKWVSEELGRVGYISKENLNSDVKVIYTLKN